MKVEFKRFKASSGARRKFPFLARHNKEGMCLVVSEEHCSYYILLLEGNKHAMWLAESALNKKQCLYIAPYGSITPVDEPVTLTNEWVLHERGDQ